MLNHPERKRRISIENQESTHEEKIMQASANAARILETDKPKSQKFSLKTPYMKQGRVTQLVAVRGYSPRTDTFALTTLFPEGGTP